MAIPVSLAAAALPKALYALGKLPRWGARLLYLALDSFATALGLAVVDMFLESVSATDAVSYTHLDVYKRQLSTLSP